MSLSRKVVDGSHFQEGEGRLRGCYKVGSRLAEISDREHLEVVLQAGRLFWGSAQDHPGGLRMASPAKLGSDLGEVNVRALFA
jgi:hypothetical protein